MKEGVARPVEAAAFRASDAGHLKRFPWADAKVLEELFIGYDLQLAALYLLGRSVDEMANRTGLTPDVINERLSGIGATLKRKGKKRK